MNSFRAKLSIIGVIAMLPIAISAYNGKNVNARAVSVQWINAGWEYPTPKCGENDFFDDGSICVYTIQNAAVTHADTIYGRTQGLAAAASFDLTGTRIAFIRENVAPAASGSACVSVNGGKNTVSLINTNGTGLINLCDLPSARLTSGENWNLDWPAGEWIYYQYPKSDGTRSLDIWKVNAVTHENVRACNFASSGSFRRFTLDVTATHMAAQIVDANSANALYNFPGGCNLGSAYICSRAACNIAISPSGQIVGSYMGGAHEDLNLAVGAGASQPCVTSAGNVNLHTDLEVWAGEKIGAGSEHIRWAVNSDKWVLQEIGWEGHAASLSMGSNQVVGNWVDKVAINISKNPRTAAGLAYRWNNTTGDMWIDDPVNNPQKNKYEDLQGAWHEVPGATAIMPESLRENPAGEAPASMLSNREIALHLPGQTAAAVLIVNLHGATVCRTIAHGRARVSLRSFPAGAYRLVITRQGARHESGFVLR